ncbi:glycosyltransferase [Candidatus Parcubacteria bacterium]|nr:glycosyltransferase [Candidatus Parcubacteria bacterium]
MRTDTLQVNKPFDLRALGYYTFLLILGAVVVFLIVLVKSRTAKEFAADPLLLGYTLFVTTFELSRLVSAAFFRRSYDKVFSVLPPEILNSPFEPTVTFVIPCKNEEEAIRNTITKCFEADYPKEKIEVIVINDGSTDRTAEILYETQKEFPNLFIIDWEDNRGKRHAMAEGFKKSSGEIIVQLDSDSYIKPETFKDFIDPFRNPEIGAVCAHADPENADYNWLTKMQTGYYFMSFRILKAAESSYYTVFCCSGCSSAYRREAVMPIIDIWMNETFLGLPVTWGDDRGITNWVLKRGYKTIYTDIAKAVTIVPTKFKQFLKQQVRWKKGWFVNSIFASKFILKTEPFVALVYFFPLILVTILTPFMATRALFYTPFAKSPATLVYYMLGVLLVATLIIIYYRFVARDNKYWPYVFIWAGINTIFLSFLLFYALLTIQNRKWGTR